MCIAHSGEPYGYITSGGMAISEQDASRVLAWNRQTVSKAWAELEQNGRIARAEDGVWYIPRMVEDYAYSLQQSELGKNGGNPTLNPTLKAPLKLEKNKSKNKNKNREESKISDEAKRLATNLLIMIEDVTGRKLVAKPSGSYKPIQALLDDGVSVAAIELTTKWLVTENQKREYPFDVQSGASLRKKWDSIQSAISKQRNATGTTKKKVWRQ